MNRIEAAIERTMPKVWALDEAKKAALEKNCAITFEEHFAYQNAQARAHAMGILTPEEAQVVYMALGEVGSEANGGWAQGTDTTTKVVVTRMIGELLTRMIGELLEKRLVTA